MREFKKVNTDLYFKTPLLRLNQWALLLAGYAPVCEPNDDPMDMPDEVYPMFKRLKTAVQDGKLTAEIGDKKKVDRTTNVRRDALKSFFNVEGEYPHTLFQEPTDA